MSPSDPLIILNPGAPRYPADEIREACETVCRDHDVRCRFLSLPVGTGARDAVRLAVAEAVGQGCERVVAAGGDGTVGLVA